MSDSVVCETEVAQIDAKLESRLPPAAEQVLSLLCRFHHKILSQSTKIIRVLIADDDPVVREGSATILKSQKDIRTAVSDGPDPPTVQVASELRLKAA